MPNRYQKSKFKAITKQYGLDLIRIKTHDSLYKKNAVYCATTNKGKFLVKALNTRSMGKDLPKKEFFSYVRKLKESHYPYAPQWLKTRSGKFLVGWHGRPYYMTEWVTGRALNREPEDYVSLGKALGHLHKLRRIHRTPTPPYTQQRIKTFKAQSHLFQQHLNYIRHKNNESSRWLEKHGEHCVQLSNEAWGILQDPKVKRLLAREKRHPTLVHGDVTIPNIVIHHRGRFLAGL